MKKREGRVKVKMKKRGGKRGKENDGKKERRK